MAYMCFYLVSFNSGYRLTPKELNLTNVLDYLGVAGKFSQRAEVSQ